MLYSRIEGQGRPLVIMHGFLGMSDNWKTLADQYALSGFEVHSLDLRNHGRSPHSDDFSYRAMVQDLLEYCDSKKLGKINLLGHSMGGKVAMFFATSHPARVEKLIVADIAPKYYPPHHDEILAGLNAVDFAKATERSDVEEVLMPYVPDFGTRQFLMKSVFRNPSGGFAFRFNLKAFNENIDIIGEELDESARYDGPTLFLKGANSRYIKDEDDVLIKKHFPSAHIISIANAGHWLHAENPKDFLSESLAFLK